MHNRPRPYSFYWSGRDRGRDHFRGDSARPPGRRTCVCYNNLWAIIIGLKLAVVAASQEAHMLGST